MSELRPSVDPDSDWRRGVDVIKTPPGMRHQCLQPFVSLLRRRKRRRRRRRVFWEGFLPTRPETQLNLDFLRGKSLLSHSGRLLRPGRPHHHQTSQDSAIRPQAAQPWVTSLQQREQNSSNINCPFFSGPNFVGAIEDESHIFFFFRELALESSHCGKVCGMVFNTFLDLTEKKLSLKHVKCNK